MIALSGCTQHSVRLPEYTACPTSRWEGGEQALLDFSQASFPPSGWGAQIPHQAAAQLTADPVDASNQVLRFELRAGEVVKTRTVTRPRTELYERYRAPFEQQINYQFRVYIPDEWHNDDVRALIAQWHGTPDTHLGEVSRSPNLGIEYRDDYFLIRSQASAMKVNQDNKTDMQRHTLYRSTPVAKNQWYQFKVQVLWSHQQHGRLKVWLDQQLLVDYQGPTAYNDCYGPYFKMGIYRDESNHSFVIFHDDYRRWLEPSS